MKKILLLAMGRSGHHAIINWIAQNHSGPVEHHNHCCLGWENKTLLPWKNRIDKYNKKMAGEKMIIKNIEDFDMDDFDLIKDFDFVKGAQVYIILRDHYNWIASSFKTGGYAKEKMNAPLENQRGELKPSRKELWIKQAEHALNNKFQSINYNKWTLDKSYRTELCSDLGLSKEDKGLLDMSRYCGGSSFEKGSSVETEKLMKRWQVFSEDQEYLKIVSDKKMVNLTEKFFGYTVDLK
jgi:hypothetical protein